jgi:hypothetical protein
MAVTEPEAVMPQAVTPVAPPSFIIGCFSGIQLGWPGLVLRQT